MTLDPRCPSGCGCRVRNQGEWCIHCWPYTDEAAATGQRLDPNPTSPMTSSNFNIETEIMSAASALFTLNKSEHAAALERIAFLVNVLQNETLNNNNEQKKET